MHIVDLFVLQMSSTATVPIAKGDLMLVSCLIVVVGTNLYSLQTEGIVSKIVVSCNTNMQSQSPWS